MTAFEWNLLKSATERIDAARRALNEEHTATALVALDNTVRRLLRQPAVSIQAEDRIKERAQ
jgi:hypothetical protein